MKKVNLVVFLFVAACIFACSKITPEPVRAKSNETAYTTVKQFQKWITRRDFVVTQYYLNNEPNNAIFPPCALDNILYFYPDGRLIELEGAEKCGVSDTADYGTYALTDSTLYLNTINIPDQYFKIIEFGPLGFKVRQVSPAFPVGADFKAIN